MEKDLIIESEERAMLAARFTDQAEDYRLSMNEAPLLWLRAKAGRTDSEKTFQAYQKTLQRFVEYLEGQGASLWSHPRLIAQLAQEWCVYSSGRPVSTSTINQRRAILSSFYDFARKHGGCEQNPIEFCERPPRHIENAAPHLEQGYVARRMQGIDTTTREGKRDKALLALALTTGRRASELAGLEWGHCTSIGGSRYYVKWVRSKGKKTIEDVLEPPVVRTLLEYLSCEYGKNLSQITKDSPVFVSYSNNNRGGKLSHQAISDIWKKHLGISQVHTTRHTFAVSMDDAGASLSEIGDRLGHSNSAVTATSMKRRRASENKYAAQLSEMFGI